MNRSITAILLAAALAGCSGAPKEYLIGAAGPLTVPSGIRMQHGIDLAVEEINHAGGIGGVPLRILPLDDGSSGAQAAHVAGEFIADKRIVAVIGHPRSSAEVAAAGVYDGGRLTALATTPSSPDLTGVSPWVFRMIASDSVNGIALARFASALADSLHRPVRVGVLYRNDAYGRGLADAFLHSFRGEVVSDDPVGPDTDLEPYVYFYKLHPPDIVFVASEAEIAVRFLREARRQHLAIRFLGGDGEGVASDSVAEGVYVGTPFAAHSSDPAIRRFVDVYRARYGDYPDASASLAYDATKLIAEAIRHAGGDREGIRAYLASLSRAKAYSALTGPMWFGRNNDPVADNFRITQVHDGAMIPVGGK